MNHKCGIAGICFFEKSSSNNAALYLYKMLLQLQHRGQLSAGITVYKGEDNFLLQTHKDLGLVNHVFRAEHKGKFLSLMEKYNSPKGIGHVRYATCGPDDKDYAQPFEHFHGKKDRWFSIAFNGNIANYESIKKELEESNYHLIRKNDTEAILLLLAKHLKSSGDITAAFSGLSAHLDGSYNIAFIDAEGRVAVARDPLGIRPLCYAVDDEKIAFASESVALQIIGFNIDSIKDLAPGSILLIENGSFSIKQFAEVKRKAHCFFEWVYFAHAASKIDGKIVYSVRRDLGRELAKLETQKIDSSCVVVAVPDSSTPCGQGFAEALKIPMQEGLIRNRYVGRTFIESKDRADRVKSKFSLIKEVFEGKKVFLVEDSIVRGTTLKNLVEFIRKQGNPKEIHVRVSCPPIKFPCYYGIDMCSKKELIACTQSVDEIRKEIGADSLI
ncbi:MAG: amidophosphoribosyltransferase, partial [archaeon]